MWLGGAVCFCASRASRAPLGPSPMSTVRAASWPPRAPPLSVGNLEQLEVESLSPWISSLEPQGLLLGPCPQVSRGLGQGDHIIKRVLLTWVLGLTGPLLPNCREPPCPQLSDKPRIPSSRLAQELALALGPRSHWPVGCLGSVRTVRPGPERQLCVLSFLFQCLF